MCCEKYGKPIKNSILPEDGIDDFPKNGTNCRQALFFVD
jgi:hypothetical protein